MNTTQGRLFTLLKLLVPLVAIVAVVLALTWRPGTEHRAAADTPHTGLDFSLGVDIDSAPDTNSANDDCDTKPGTITPTATCNIPAGTTFVVRVYLNNRGGVSYTGIDTYVTYAGVTSKNNPDNADWSGCSIRASFIQSGSVRWSCVAGVGEPASVQQGAVGKTSFNCPPSVVTNGATITLVHGSTDTSLSESGDPPPVHAEGEGTAEALTVNCTLPPTNTPSSTRSPTATNTLAPTATRTRTPTNTATPTRTATPTPLASERADVNVTKTDLQDPAAPGSSLTYRLVVRNKGVETALDVTATDLLPTEVIFDSYSSAGATCTFVANYVPPNDGVVCDLGDMGPGAVVTIDIIVITPTPQTDIRIGNFVLVGASNEPFENIGDNQDAEQTVILAPRADLTLVKVDKTDPVESEALLTYNLTVENIGNGSAENVVINEDLPAGAGFKSSSGSCSVPQGAPLPDPEGKLLGGVDLQCNLGTIDPGDPPVAVQIVVNAPRTKQDLKILNLAYVTGDNELFGQTGNNFDIEGTALLAPPPDLSVDKQGPASVLRAGYFSYTLTIRNDGQGHAFNVQVVDTLPKKALLKKGRYNILPVTFISSKGAVCSNPFGTNLVNCKIAKLQGNGGQLVITLNVRAPSGILVQNVVTNQVTVSDPDEPDDPQGNNSDSVDTKLIPCFDTTGDLRVRGQDISLVVERYGLGVGDPGYDILYDIDGNGRILGPDISLIVLHYGEDC